MLYDSENVNQLLPVFFICFFSAFFQLFFFFGGGGGGEGVGWDGVPFLVCFAQV